MTSVLFAKHIFEEIGQRRVNNGLIVLIDYLLKPRVLPEGLQVAVVNADLLEFVVASYEGLLQAL